MTRLGKLIGDRRGASAVEYSLILALIVLAMIAGLRLVATSTTGMWNTVSDNVLNNA
jgi:pilus assembly protein Flp/PilA